MFVISSSSQGRPDPLLNCFRNKMLLSFVHKCAYTYFSSVCLNPPLGVNITYLEVIYVCSIADSCNIVEFATIL